MDLASPFLTLLLAVSPGLPQEAVPAAPQATGVSPAELEALAKRYGERWTPEARAYRIAGPAVVSVQSFRKRGLGQGNNVGTTPLGAPVSQGTGVVIDPQGFVVTNAHVIVPDESEDANNYQCWLRFADDFGGRQVRAEVLSLDREWDLGLLKILDEGPFEALPLYTEDDPLIGERVMALGSPYGSSLSLTAGLLSGMDRTIRVMGLKNVVHTLTGLLQTDVAINPGNSGGPLLNVYGQLIGICTASLTNAEGVAYAIPSTRVREILMARLMQPRVWNGIQLRAASLVVEHLHPRGPAARAGLAEGDLLTSLDGAPIADPAAWQRALVLRRPGDTVSLGYRRGGAAEASARFVLADAAARGTVGILGFTAERERLPVPGLAGETIMTLLRVREVFLGSGAATLGLATGDTIVAVHLSNKANGDGWVPVATQEQLLSIIQGPDFDFESLNLWWVKSDGSSLKGRLTFDDPALRYGPS